MAGYKEQYQAEKKRADAAEQERDALKQERNEWRKKAQASEARATRTAKLLDDGSDAGTLRAQLAAAQAEADSLRAEKNWQAHEGQDIALQGIQAEIGGHDIKYWHELALSMKEAYWQRTEQVSELTKKLEKARKGTPANATIDGHDMDYWHRLAVELSDTKGKQSIDYMRQTIEIGEVCDRLTAERDKLASEVKRLKEAQGGRPKSFSGLQALTTATKAREMRAQGKTYQQIAEAIGTSESTLRRLLKRVQEKK